jgi:hypothetical protein
VNDIRDQIRASGMKIIGFTGRAGSGKSTFASELGRVVGFHVRTAFADPIRSVALAIFGSEYKSQSEKSATDAFWADRLGEQWSTGRKILQRLGTEIGRQAINENLWLHCFERRLMGLAARTTVNHPKPLVTVEDVRFSNEAALVKELGGTVIRLINTNHGPLTDAHASEAGVPDDLVDQTYEIGSEDDVRRIARAYGSCMGRNR